MAPKQPPKRRKIAEPPSQSRRDVSKGTVATSVTVSEAQTSSGGVSLISSIQQGRDFAVAQAQQDGVLGNFKIFDSPFGFSCSCNSNFQGTG
ncbi:hypothetical protein M0R45_003451 [Rubus argutus]|uniref:Uncharacterized protein n=1 Tax=Rubus argutus TaxID=59490 RepID=A0AAW1YF64_RUBAR